MTGKELLKARKELGLTQQELASMLGITFNTICRWEKGKVKPSKFYAQHVETFIERKLAKEKKRG